MRPSQLLAALVAVSSVSASAWSDVFDNVQALGDVKNVIYGRQENSDTAEQPSATREAPQSSAKEEDPKSTEETKETGKASGSERPSETAKETGKAKSSKKPAPTAFDPRLPPGGISMITPAPIAGPQYYKVGDWVTFAWNYTSLSVTPKAVDILATCKANQATYTLAVNQTVKATGLVEWDTGGYQATASQKLLTEMYTLIIYDSNASMTDPPKPGYLAPYSQFQFGMYLPQKYVPWKDFQCANCNSALSSFERMTLKVLLFTCGTTIGSLLYFAHSFGVL